jgi:hypothetical protein
MKILFVGLGNLGAQVFDLFLLRSTSEQQFLVAGRNIDYIRRRVAHTTYAAMQLGLTPNVDCASMDVQNIDQTAQTISTFKPDVIFTSVTVQASSAISKLPRPIFEKLVPAQSGPWLPLTLVLVYKLMRAVKQTGLPVAVLNAAASDNAHAALGKVGLAPTTGTGNLANLIPALRKSIASQLNRSWEQVSVLFVGHNQVAYRLRTRGTIDEAPFYLTASVEGEDVTQQIDLQAVFQSLPETMHEFTQLVSAASVATIFDAITGKTHGIVHAPGPNGLPGAYPIRMRERGIEVVLPQGLTLEQAVHINQEGQKLDGIERLEDDGTVYFADKNMAILKEALGYDCKRMPLSEVEYWAKELRTKYIAFASRFGLTFP